MGVKSTITITHQDAINKLLDHFDEYRNGGINDLDNSRLGSLLTCIDDANSLCGESFNNYMVVDNDYEFPSY